MFDQPLTNQPKNSGSANPPVNLPTYDSVPPLGPKPGNFTPPEPEDILGDVDNQPAPAAAPLAQPLTNVAPRPAVAQPSASTMPSAATPKPSSRFNFKKIMIFTVVILVVLGGLGAGAYYSYGSLQEAMITSFASNFPSNQNANTGAVVNNNINNNPTQPVNNNAAVNTNVAAAPAADLDTDQDGLTDQQEAVYGTNPDMPDTDGDGFTDRDEVKVWETDPLNPDTDGDGYKDGEEVKNGYNPKGPGKLLNLPQ